MLPDNIYKPELTENVGTTPVDVAFLLNACKDLLCRNEAELVTIINFDRDNLLDLLRLTLEISNSMQL